MLYQTLWIPAAIAGGVALATTIAGSIARKKEAKRQRQFEIDQQNKANEYNSPKAQMDRFKNANLNPNLIYGSSPSGAAGEFATREGRDIEIQGEGNQMLASGIGATVDQGLQAYYSHEQHKAGMDKLEADTRKVNLDNDRESILQTYRNKTIPERIKKEMEQLSTETELLELRKRHQELVNDTSQENLLQSINATHKTDYDRIERQYGTGHVKRIQEIHDATLAEIKSRTSGNLQQQELAKFELEYLKLVKKHTGNLGPAFQTGVRLLATKFLK